MLFTRKGSDFSKSRAAHLAGLPRAQNAPKGKHQPLTISLKQIWAQNFRKILHFISGQRHSSNHVFAAKSSFFWQAPNEPRIRWPLTYFRVPQKCACDASRWPNGLFSVSAIFTKTINIIEASKRIKINFCVFL